MFSVSEIQEPSEFKNYSMFKAWWDILLDYLVAATALNILLLLTRIATVDTGGLICVHPIQGYSYGYVESRYVNSRCCSESRAWIVIFHPYVMLLLWMCITACHVCWIKIPVIHTKLEAFYAILFKIFTTQPKFYRNPHSLRMTQELSYNETNQRAIDLMLNKLLYLMTEQPYLRTYYMLRHLIIIFFCLVSVGYAIFVIAFLATYPSSFSCYLPHNPPLTRGYPFINDTSIPTPCHLNIGPFIYVLIHVDCFIRLIMIVLCIKGASWAFKGTSKRAKSSVNQDFDRQEGSTSDVRRSLLESTTTNMEDTFKPTESIFGEAAEYLSGMPSYPDLLFCIDLLRRNVHDGHLMYEAICTSIRNYVKKLQAHGKSYIKRSELDKQRRLRMGMRSDQPKQDLDKQPKSFQECVIFIRWITRELGLEEVPNLMDSNHLFVCIQFIKESVGIVDLKAESSMKEVIVENLHSHPELYKTMIDDDTNFPDYETHLENLKKPTTYGSHYALLAAATMLNVRLVIIHCEPASKLPEVYNPLRSNLLATDNLRGRSTNEHETFSPVSVPTRFLTFVTPHFYHATVDMPVNPDWPQVVSRRMLYATDRRFRADLRRNAVRSVIVQSTAAL